MTGLPQSRSTSGPEETWILAARIALFSTLAGGLFGLLADAASLPLRGNTPIPLGLILSFGLGAIIGLLATLVAIPLLKNRELKYARPPILWLTGPIVVVASMVFQEANGSTIGVSVVAYLGAILMTWKVLPRVYHVSGRCFRCGYDIRASLQFGRCPECGHQIKTRDSGSSPNPVHSPSTTQAPLVLRTTSVIWRNPSLAILSVALVLVAPTLMRDHRRATRVEGVLAAMRTAALSGNTLDMRVAITIEWDQMFVFGPYTDLEQIQ